MKQQKHIEELSEVMEPFIETVAIFQGFLNDGDIPDEELVDFHAALSCMQYKLGGIIYANNITSIYEIDEDDDL